MAQLMIDLQPSAKKFRQMDGQCAKILADLKAGMAVENNLETMARYQCVRIGARIFDLREAGYNITTEKGDSGQAVYRLESDDD